jgi:hypothetical protein
MKRFLLSAAAVAAVSALATAQCFEPNLGTSLGVGDDVLYPAAGPVAMGIVFPMGGVSPTYTTIRASTNGAAFLSNGVDLGSTSTFSPTVALLQAGAGQGPVIAAYWQDLNLLAANAAGLYLNNTLPGKCVVTWKNAVHYGTTSPVFTVQAQLFASGQISIFYSPNLNNVATTPICGVSAGNAIADPGVTDLSVGSVGVSTSMIMYQTFPAVNTFDLNGTTVTFTPNPLGGYDESDSVCTPASNSNYGSGCYLVSGTWYETFAAAMDLGGTAIHMTPAGGGYLMTPGAPTAFVHSVPGLMLTDDSVATLTLPSPFTYPGGATTAMSICSNGYIWMQTPNLVADYSPTVAELFSSPSRLCPCWVDTVPDGATNTNNVFGEVDVPNNKAYVTWVHVPLFSGGGEINMQVQFDLVTGEVNITYGLMSEISTSIVGWAPGTGLSTIDPGNRDVSATIGGSFSTATPERSALALACSPAPVLGSTITWTTSNIPGAAIVSGNLLSFGQFNPGIDLTGAGAPGCFQYVDLTVSATTLLFGSPTATNSFFIPNVAVYAGTNLYSQSVSLVPGVNALGVLTSNGVKTFINSF